MKQVKPEDLQKDKNYLFVSKDKKTVIWSKLNYKDIQVFCIPGGGKGADFFIYNFDFYSMPDGFYIKVNQAWKSGEDNESRYILMGTIRSKYPAVLNAASGISHSELSLSNFEDAPDELELYEFEGKKYNIEDVRKRFAELKEVK